MTWGWPWVSRRAYEAQGASYITTLGELSRKCDAIIAVYERATADAEKRHADLLARYHMLKLQGAVVVEPTQTPVIAKPDIVKTAIARAARGSEELIRQMEVAAERDRAAGLSDDEIVRRIRAGNRVQSEFEVPTTPTPSGDASVS